MISFRSAALGLLASLVVSVLTGNVVPAADLIVGSGETQTISDLRSLTTEKYGNEGRLDILAGGILSIGTGVQNNTPLPEGTLGLDLGKVFNEGFIESLQTIRFQANSQLGGIVRSSDRVIFDGAVTVTGDISTKMIVFNQGSDATMYSGVDLTAIGAGLNADHLIINGKVEIIMPDGTPFETSILDLGQSGAVLEVTEDIVVKDNFLAAAGSGLASKLDAAGNGKGNILLTGGGGYIKEKEIAALGEFNNLLAGTIKAETLTIQGRSYIRGFFNVVGDLVLDTGSHSESAESLLVTGRLFMNDGASLKLDADTSHMILVDIWPFNGIFHGGFELATGSSLMSMANDGSVFLAVYDDSAIHAGATLEAKDVLLAGFKDENGEVKQRRITNSGTINSEMLYLVSMNMTNNGDGIIDVNSLLLTNNSVLDLCDNNAPDGGLTFSGNDKSVYISYDSQLTAAGKTLEFVGVTVENRNMDSGGLHAAGLRFGEGATLLGTGKVYADTVFGANSKLILGVNYPTVDETTGIVTGYGNNYGVIATDFGNKDVTFESGATIAMTIDPGGYGMIATTGMVKTNDGVFLKILDGSNFEGRTMVFCIAQGGVGSEFSENLEFVDSLFFRLAGVIPIESGWSDPSLDNTLWVEIVKVADMVDYAGSQNQKEFARMLDRLLENNKASNAQKQAFDALMLSRTDAEYRQGLNSLLGDLRANGLVAAMSQPWRVPLERAGMERLSLYVPRRGRTAGLAASESELLGQSAKPFQCNLWFDTNYNHLNLRSDGNASGGLGDRYGANIGVEWTPTHETLFGWTFGYAYNSFTQNNGHLHINDYQFGLYGGANLFKRNFQLRGYVGYGHLDFTHDRYVSLPNDSYTAHGSTPGDSLSASLMLIRPVDLSDRFMFKPAFGIDVERISQKGFQEYGDPAILLSYSGTDYLRTMLRFGASGEHSFRRGTIWGRLFYGLRVAGDTAAFSRNQFVGITEPGVAVYSINVGDSVFDVGLGGKRSLNAAKTLWLFGDYNGSFTKRSESHAGSLGFLWKR